MAAAENTDVTLACTIKLGLDNTCDRHEPPLGVLRIGLNQKQQQSAYL